jgi:hypothetical protein
MEMSGMTSALTSDQSDELKQLRLIEYLSHGVYRVRLVSNSGDVLDTIGRVCDVDLGGGKIDSVVNFDSEEFGRQVMNGQIHAQPICQAIRTFHKSCVEQLTRQKE